MPSGGRTGPETNPTGAQLGFSRLRDRPLQGVQSEMIGALPMSGI